LKGHALSPRLAPRGATFPYLLLLVSGGHCQFISVLDVGVYRRLGSTIDDALGEAFDKLAKLLDLGFPGGPFVEKAARNGDSEAFRVAAPVAWPRRLRFFFCWFENRLHARSERLGVMTDQDKADLCASFQAAVLDIID
jgi:N6-L-threonylcarbamoyladenine synthase